ncbi:MULTISPECIES: GNAT family N-acetyltransferase [Cytobacillus]|uniref:GNAT family N-acetyltransferase n=1 Tax=Cytobacillus stercorigallinarum TaxID=2762240 RepID=A0ABR8QST0_9BACI|nr:GNAT family N-acetyltransferase [Cytobacillus stercorigallinarum]MBD7938598.1 GNAT family N-acetyltransferase [Cytobacillus stercorigallinarum]
MIYTSNLQDITIDRLSGFFVGWGNYPQPDTHLYLMQNSYKAIVAIDETNERVVGFITAISDGVISAYIPLLEVRPDYQQQGIGETLVKMMLQELSDIYMIDLSCDDDLIPYYERFAMKKGNSMIIRNYERQSGRKIKRSI